MRDAVAGVAAVVGAGDAEAVVGDAVAGVAVVGDAVVGDAVVGRGTVECPCGSVSLSTSGDVY